MHQIIDEKGKKEKMYMNNVLERTDNFYNTLNVEYDASYEEIKKSYKKLALKFHPDVYRDDVFGNKFKDIVKAYSVLRDKKQRNEYNKQLKNGEGFFLKIDFQYSIKEFAKTTDKIFSNFKIFFKNISENKIKDKPQKKGPDENIFDLGIRIPDSILSMSLDELGERLQYSQNQFVRKNAAIAVGYKMEKKANGILENVIMDPDYEVRKAIIWSIGNLKMRKSLKFLKLLYNSTLSPLKFDILKSIYKIADGKGMLLNNLLLQALEDDFEEVSIGAVKLLLLNGKKLFYRDVSKIFKNVSLENRDLIERLIADNKIIV